MSRIITLDNISSEVDEIKRTKTTIGSYDPLMEKIIKPLSVNWDRPDVWIASFLILKGFEACKKEGIIITEVIESQ